MADSARRRPLREAAPLFFALGDGTRIELLERLAAGGPDSITALSAGTAVSRQAVTKHLKVLEAAGLVLGQKQGREHLWVLLPARLDEAGSYLARISTQWDAALERLRAFVEE